MKELDVLKKAMREAAEAVMKIYETDFDIEYKEDESPLTQADLVADKILRERLLPLGHAWLSEETADDGSRSDAETVWIIDPIDGTKDFVQKTGEFSIMAGLVKNGEPVLGAVCVPAKNELIWAVKGEGAFVEPISGGEARRLAVRTETDPKNMKMIVSRNHLSEESKRFAKELEVGEFVPIGSVGLKACEVARGDADLYTNTGLGKSWEWDACAGDIILSEAGGTMTDLDGNPMSYNKDVPKNMRGIIASSGTIHEKAVRTMASVMERSSNEFLGADAEFVPRAATSKSNAAGTTRLVPLLRMMSGTARTLNAMGLGRLTKAVRGSGVSAALTKANTKQGKKHRMSPET